MQIIRILLSFFNESFDFKLSFYNLFLGDDKIGHHVVVDFPKEYKILFQIPNNQEFNENNVYQNSEYGNS